MDIGHYQQHHRGAFNGHVQRKDRRPSVGAVTLLVVAFFVVTTWVAGHRSVLSVRNSLDEHHMDPPDGWARVRHDSGGGGGGDGGGTNGDGGGAAPSGLSRVFGALQGHWLSAGGGADGLLGGISGGGTTPTTSDGHAVVNTLPDSERDIVLDSAKVARVVERARAREQVQLLSQGGGAELAAGVHTAEAYADLYGAGTGTLVYPESDGRGGCPTGSPSPRGAAAAIVVLAGPSPARLRRCLVALLAELAGGPPDARGAFHVFVSLAGVGGSGGDAASGGEQPLVKQVAMKYVMETHGAVRLLQFNGTSSGGGGGDGGASASQQQHLGPAHVRFALRAVLDCFGYPAALLLDDALTPAPDALDYFASAAWLLGSDPSLGCIAGWNEQAPAAPAADAAMGVLWRTDYHPGRGFLLSRALGLELLASPEWGHKALSSGSSSSNGAAAVAELLRADAARGARQCIVPEVPRVFDAAAAALAAALNPSAGSEAAARAAGDALTAGSEHDLTATSIAHAVAAHTAAVAAEAAAKAAKAAAELAAATEGDGGEDGAVADGNATATGSTAAATTAAEGANATTGGGVRAARVRDEFGELVTSWADMDLSFLLASDYARHMRAALARSRLVPLREALELRRAAANGSSSAGSGAGGNGGSSASASAPGSGDDSDAAGPSSSGDGDDDGDVAAASCAVAYGTAAEYAAAASALGLNAQRVAECRYCYQVPVAPLPAAPPQPGAPPPPEREACQDFAPPQAWRGVVMARNRHGARVFLLPRPWASLLPVGVTRK